MKKLIAPLLTGLSISLAASAAHAAPQAGVVWTNASTGEIGVWEADEHGNVLKMYDMTTTCGKNCILTPVGAGIFERDATGVGSPKFDTLWWSPLTNDFEDLERDPGEHWVDLGVCPTCNAYTRPIGSGHFLGSGTYDQFVTLNTQTGVLTVQYLSQDSSSTGHFQQPPQDLPVPCPSACQAIWEPIGTAYLTSEVNVNDNYTNIVWHNKMTGDISAWILNSKGQWLGSLTLPAPWKCGPDCWKQWAPVGFADFDGDGHRDLLWYNATSGQLGAWLLNGGGGGVNGVLMLSAVCGTVNGCQQWKPIAAVSVRYRPF